MAITKYTYSVSSDFPDGKINLSNFYEEILSNNEITVSLNDISLTGDIVDIFFNAELSVDEKLLLDGDELGPAGGMIASHDSTEYQAINETIIRENRTSPPTKVGTQNITVGPSDIGICDLLLPYASGIQGVNIQWKNMERGDYCDIGVLLTASFTNPTEESLSGSSVVKINPSISFLYDPSFLNLENPEMEFYDNLGEFKFSIEIDSVTSEDVTLKSELPETVGVDWTVKCSPEKYVFSGTGFGMLGNGDWDYIIPHIVSASISGGNYISTKVYTTADGATRDFVVNFICRKG